MYIDAKKFDYSKFSYPEAKKLVERDKDFVRGAYRKWMEETVHDIVERQWEINDIGAIEKVGDFVKLLKEAEFTYSLGAYTSTIALVGVCAEDLCRFFATNAGHKLDSQTQHDRVNSLLKLGAITQDTADKFGVIRQLRNDCLHYNSGFKQKDVSALQADALNAINTIKATYAGIMGVIDYKTVDASKFSEMIETITREAVNVDSNGLGVDEALTRARNLFASVFGMDLSLNNGGRPVYITSIYFVDEIDSKIDPPELGLIDEISKIPVTVDMNEVEMHNISKERIKEGDIVAATLMSIPNKLGTTGIWRLWGSVKKLN
ncbi:MAG TPA: DUF4145 domain-containing protein [bacterium]|nr:DUF4145 domain-containing protein [bacterium]